jgi:hypothetical protein
LILASVLTCRRQPDWAGSSPARCPILPCPGAAVKGRTHPFKSRQAGQEVVDRYASCCYTCATTAKHAAGDRPRSNRGIHVARGLLDRARNAESRILPSWGYRADGVSARASSAGHRRLTEDERSYRIVRAVSSGWGRGSRRLRRPDAPGEYAFLQHYYGERAVSAVRHLSCLDILSTGISAGPWRPRRMLVPTASERKVWSGRVPGGGLSRPPSLYSPRVLRDG